MAAQRCLVFELRQALLALVGKIVRMDPDVLHPVGLLRETLRTNPAPILGEGKAGPVADVPGQGRCVLELFQTVRALVRPVVIARVLRQGQGRFERLWTVPAAMFSASGGYADRSDDNRGGQLRSGSFDADCQENSGWSLPVVGCWR